MSAPSYAVGALTDQRKLPVCETDDPEKLNTTMDGLPVWPVTSPQEAARLARLTTLFGGELYFPKTLSSQLTAQKETVVCLNAASATHGRLYAHLTGRSFKIIRSASDLRDDPDISVVVVKFDDLTPALLETIHQTAKERSAPGVICGANDTELRMRVLSCSAALFLSTRIVRKDFESPEWIDILPRTAVKYTAKKRQILGANSSKQSVRSALTDGVGLLRVVTTCDGIDAFLGKHTILCPMGHPEATVSTAKSPRCVTTGYCHRLAMPMKDALRSEVLLHPAMIRAKIMLWQTCLGILVGSEETDNKWGLGLQLLQTETIGALITGCDCLLTAAYCTENLVEQIASGQTIGSALHRFYDADETLVHRLFIFGDPNLALHAIPYPKNRSIFRPANYRPRRRTTDSDHVIVRDPEVVAMLKAIRVPRRRVEDNRAELALSLGRRWLSRSRIGDPDLSEASRIPAQLRDALVRYMASRQWARWVDDWFQDQASIERLPGGTSCPTCRVAADSYLVALRTSMALKRRLSVCRRCGIIEDVPSDSSIRFTVSPGGKCKLTGALPSTHWTAYLVVFSGNENETTLQRWPNSPDGSPQRHFAAGNRWPVGPLRFAFLLVSRSWHMLLV